MSGEAKENWIGNVARKPLRVSGPRLTACVQGAPRIIKAKSIANPCHPETNPCDETKSKYSFAWGYSGSVS